jgi:microcystin-dependent protein
MPYPANPATGDEYVLSGKTWKYNGSRWSKLGFSQTISAEVANSPGTLIYHSANTAPTGYIKANGAAVSRTTYADLFTAIGTTYGAGDGSSTFNVPDLRGEFMRSWDDARGIDNGRNFGSSQADELKAHTHTFSTHYNTGAGGVPLQGTSSPTGTVTTSSTGGTETRPRNIAFLACIKY